MNILKNPHGKFTAKQLAALRKGYAKIKGIDPGKPTYANLTLMLDGMTQTQLKQLANAEIKFVSGLASNRIKRKGNPKMARKKKRSAKQLANDRRLGRMAKARAKKKRGGRRKKVARKNPHRKIRAPGAKRRIRAPAAKRKVSAKSHLWLIFACKGKVVQWMRLTTNVKYFFGSDKGKALRFSTKSEALKIAKGLKGTRGWQLGVISDDISAAQIAAHCTEGKA